MTNYMKRCLILSLSVFMLIAAGAHATQTDTLKFNQERVFVGAKIGMAAAEADFSSFGADKFRPGWAAGINAGYRFNDVWSVELDASWGQVFLTEQNCCLDRHYFLGSDINRYHPVLIPDGMAGHYYEDLKSKTFVQKYGVLANMNILGFFKSCKGGPWSLELSPAIYAVGTSSDIVAKADNSPFIDNINKWHLGYGARIQASYAFAKNMNIGLYGSFTQLAGKKLDGMPKLHMSNNIMDFGIKFTIGFLKRPTKQRSTVQMNPTAAHAIPTPQAEKAKAETSPVQQSATADVATVVIPAEKSVQQTTVTPTQQPVSTESADIKPSTAPVVPQHNVIAETPVKNHDKTPTPTDSGITSETVADESCSCKVKDSTFPVIYFSFNSIWIEPSERAKVKEIADKMKADKSIRIRVTGWCDPVGSEAANKRVSLQRAEAVKRVLGQWLVAADRIETAGGGICKDAASYDEARCALTIEIL